MSIQWDCARYGSQANRFYPWNLSWIQWILYQRWHIAQFPSAREMIYATGLFLSSVRLYIEVLQHLVCFLLQKDLASNVYIDLNFVLQHLAYVILVGLQILVIWCLQSKFVVDLLTLQLDVSSPSLLLVCSGDAMIGCIFSNFSWSAMWTLQLDAFGESSCWLNVQSSFPI